MKHKDLQEQKYLKMAKYMIKHNTTLRQTAALYDIPKSTLHRKLHKYVSKYHIYTKLCKLLDYNFMDKCNRGAKVMRQTKERSRI